MDRGSAKAVRQGRAPLPKDMDLIDGIGLKRTVPNAEELESVRRRGFHGPNKWRVKP